MSKQAFKRVRKALHIEVNREPLPAYAWPGGYPIFYLFSDGEPCCPTCANNQIELVDIGIKERPRHGWQLVGTEINFQDTELYCWHCGKKIESAYGDEE